MSKRNNTTLTQQHLRDVVQLKAHQKKELRPIWAVTWNTRGETLVPLGSASMMVMVADPDHQNPNKDRISLFCIVAAARGNVISYDQCVMRHDFSKTPYAGAYNNILDPQDEGDPNVSPAHRPNGSWVQLGLAVQHDRRKAVRTSHQLGTVPQLPDFLAGYDSPITGVDPTLWRGPCTEGNKYNLYLIDTRYVDMVANPPRAVFEDFSKMVGDRAANPARTLDGTVYPLENPSRKLAEAHGWDLSALLTIVAKGGQLDEVVVESDDTPHDGMSGSDIPEMTPTEFTSAYDDALDRLLELQQEVQTTLAPANRAALDAAGYCWDRAVLHPDAPLPVPLGGDIISQVGEAAAIRLLRDQLKKSKAVLSPGTTDTDLVAAAKAPGRPLFASQYCAVQVKHREVGLGESAFAFSSDMLGRPGVTANFYPTFERKGSGHVKSRQKTHA